MLYLSHVGRCLHEAGLEETSEEQVNAFPWKQCPGCERWMCPRCVEIKKVDHHVVCQAEARAAKKAAAAAKKAATAEKRAATALQKAKEHEIKVWALR